MFTNLLHVLSSTILASTLTTHDAASVDTGDRVSLWGVDICVGNPVAPGECDVRVPAVPKPPETSGDPQDGGASATVANSAASEPRPLKLELFGKRLCIGRVSPGERCDWKLLADETA